MILKRLAIGALVICSLSIAGWIGHNDYSELNQLYFSLDMQSSQPGVSQIFFDVGRGNNEQDSSSLPIRSGAFQKYSFPLPAFAPIKSIRFDPTNVSSVISIKKAGIENAKGETLKNFPVQSFKSIHQISRMDISKDVLTIHTTENANDPIIEIANSSIDNHVSWTNYIKKRGWIIIGYSLLSLLFLIGLIYFVIFAVRNQYIIGGVRCLKIYMSASNKILNRFNSGNLGLSVNVVLWIVLLITTIAKFVPFSPEMPAASLDPSWSFGMNQAVAQGLSIGKEIIFTFGPYASIYTKSYHPSTDFMMISGSLYLALSYWACFILLMRGVQLRWVLAFCAILAGLMDSRDALFFSFPLLVGLTTFKIVFSADGVLAKSKYAPFYVALLFAPFGLLPLVKGSILILCGAIAALCSVFFIINKKRALAIICLTTPIVSMLLFWIASGQSVTNLPNYFISMAPIVFGYTEAMASNGNTLEIILYLVASALLLLLIYLQKQITSTSKLFLLCIFFVFLFLSFKGGFVREDHSIISGTSILIAALLLPFIINSRIILLVIAFSLISWFYIDSHYIKISPANITNNIVSTYSSPWHGFKNRIKDENWPRRDFDAAVDFLRKQASFPVLQGTTDIYSYNQSYLIASGNTWSPRPIFQSYSVYTPMLAEENRKHLLGGQAPDNVIFRVEPIDGRVPSIEDGASWPILMANYRPTSMDNDFLFLRKKLGIDEITVPVKLMSETHSFGESVNLPQSNQSIFVQIEIKPTFWGHIASIFFKPSQLQITIELKNGTKKQYRIIAGMAKSGFLMSPLIENTVEFGMLYGKKKDLDGKLVKSYTIAPSHGKTVLWNDEYTVTLSQIRATSPYNLSKIYKFDGFYDELLGSKVTYTEKCDGCIDEVNGTSPAPAHFSASGLLRVNGWLAASVDKATLPEAVYVVLTDVHGNHSYLKTRRTPRPDVGAHFKKPELNASGYSTFADISALEGQYTLGLALKQSDKIKICPQFKIPVTITKFQED